MEHRRSLHRRERAMRDASQRRMDLCSACRGDYEDPDVSAMRDGSSASEDDGDDNDNDSDEEFPARRERR
jgi:hypothetical protein